jgi:two-component system response regulator AlgR
VNRPPATVLIVDDEPPARERLERLIAELPEWQVAATCATGAEALELIPRLGPAVVLLDIRMPGMSGLEAARHLAALESPPAVVFTTAYDQYALEAFDSQAVGYLLKPIRRERLAEALKHASRLSAPKLHELAAAGPAAPRQHVAARVREELRLIPVKDIRYFRADQKYVTVRHPHGEELIDESLRLLAREFADGFVRIHRSYLAAVAHAQALDRDAEGRHWLRLRGCQEALPVSRRQLGELRRRVGAAR